MTDKDPPHIGGFIRDDIIAPAGLTVTEAARILGVSRPALSKLLNEKAGLSAEMALRIEMGFGMNMALLMDMQTCYDVARARRRQAEIKVRPFAASGNLS